MAWSIRNLSAAIGLCCWLGLPAHAAEIRCDRFYDFDYTGSQQRREVARKLWPSGRTPTPGMACADGFLSGPIETGDYEKILKFYRANHPFLGAFKLVSLGGVVSEALKIGALFRRYLIETWAPYRFAGSDPVLFAASKLNEQISYLCHGEACVCVSACALIWFGGVERYGSVGLHRPRIEDTGFKALSPGEASLVYRRLLENIAVYLDEMEVPKSMVESMVATGSAEIRWVDYSNDSLQRPPSMAEWEDASCGSFPQVEEETMLSLMTKGSNRSRQEEMLFKLLFGKSNAKSNCKNTLISSQRDRLVPP